MRNEKQNAFPDFETESKNYFHVEDEFFLIDSDHFQNVKTKFYGYSVQKNGIYENDNLTEAAVSGLDGCGSYVYVEVKGGTISIRQDFSGSYGIYLYHKENHFVLSNSFFRLLEYLKTRVLLSLNRNYANYMFVEDLSSLSVYETPVNEISIVNKNAVISINTERKTIAFDYVDYQEDSVFPDSAEGMEILDRWFQRWTVLFRDLRKYTDQLNVSLSGGFDSRLTFLLALQSGIDLNGIRVNSVKDTLHTHVDDYRIASEIADYYGFRLNTINAIEDSGGVLLNDDGSFPEAAINYSLEDIINIELYTKMAFHKELFFRHHKCEAKKYFISGAGGESVRAYFDGTAQEFIDVYCKKAQRYPRNIADEISKSVTEVIADVYETIREKYRLEDDGSNRYPYYLHRDARYNIHFGKWAVEDYCYNSYTLSPLLDPEFRKLKLSVPECTDNNLLMAIIYARYCPELLNFGFDKGRSIQQETIEFARTINKKFPEKMCAPFNDTEEADREFYVNTKDSRVSEYLKEPQKNKNIQAGVPEKYLKAVFDSTVFRKLFAAYFDEDIYKFAENSYMSKKYFPMRECYAILGITKVIENIIVSRGCCSGSTIQNMDGFLYESYHETDEDEKLLVRLRNHITAKIDFKLTGTENAGLEVVSVSDHKVEIIKPKWIQKNEDGYTVESYKGILDIALRASAAGSLVIKLGGRYVCDRNGNRIQYWIDYKNIRYNDNIVTEEVKPVWNDKPLYLEYPVKEREIIRLHAEWLPHQYDNTDFENLKVLFMRLRNHITARMDFKFSGAENSDLELVSVSDHNAQIVKPEWLQKDGSGYMIESTGGVLDVSLRASGSGNLVAWLRGKDVRDQDGNRVPYWIDYTNIRYNDNIISEEVKPAWHDKPVQMEYPIKAGETIRLHVEWLPHRSDEIGIKETETGDKQENIQSIESP
ncbi:MAG: hypothetical protein HFG80_02225 [Eubacterium sp.]|nr:hypothetical protein [Eubacterium sp.]